MTRKASTRRFDALEVEMEAAREKAASSRK
jgi:hypothetical protein